MTNNAEIQYSIPAKFRRMENMHIVFWLVKDISWCMIWKELGLAMFIPTLVIAIIISWQTRHIKAELTHNLAITFWICANGYWMISEFFGFDEKIVWSWVTGKHLALFPFITGAIILLYYYAVQRPGEIKINRQAKK
jgi:prepilin signal peptidase PulO-like enzyme (type II secretory pathway)